MKIPTFQDRLRDAEFWRKTNELAELRRAEQILREGMADHHYALPLGDELALVLEKQGRDAEALELLKELERRHQNAGERYGHNRSGKTLQHSALLANRSRSR